MPGYALTTLAKLQCPHGGQVQIVSANGKSSADGAMLATASDTFIVTGCTFQLPGPVPSPCVSVTWLIPDTRVSVLGQNTLSQSSTGLCLAATQMPQGPVIVTSTQTRTKTM